MESGFFEINGTRLKGFLVNISTSGQCEIWYPYSLEIMRLLSSGVFLAVKNIMSLDPVETAKECEHYAILQVLSKSVTHFTIEDMRRMTRPTRIQEEFEKVRLDWSRRLHDEENDKLRIIVEAEITDGNLICKKGIPMQIGPVASEPIHGEDVYLLRSDLVDAFTNAHLSSPGNGGVQIAWHKLYSKVPLCIDYDGLITRHFGVFGYTGSGKSNLVSTLLARIAHEDSRRVTERSVPGLNLFVFDVNNEYIILLIDQLIKRSDAYVVCLDEGVITGNIRNFMKGDVRYLDHAARDLIAGTTAPRDIQKSKNYQLCHLLAKTLLVQGKVRMFNPYYGDDYTFGQFMQEAIQFIEELSVPGLGTQKKQQVLDIILGEGRKFEESTQPIINRLVEYGTLIANLEVRDKAVASGLVKVLEFFKKSLDEIVERSAYVYGIGRNELMSLCHDSQSSLAIFLASSENELRVFSGAFVQDIYQLRKNRGIIEPNVLFFYDEADLFMPGTTAMEYADKEERKLLNTSVKACETLARRGRKYGLGLGFATQRTTYLNTTIMGQVGTYFVGRLPRQVDRDTIVNSFGSADSSVFSQTAMFGSGSWLVMSHTALARRIPIAIQAENANERILSFLEEAKVIIEREKKPDVPTDRLPEVPPPSEVTDEDVEAYFPVEAQSYSKADVESTADSPADSNHQDEDGTHGKSAGKKDGTPAEDPVDEKDNQKGMTHQGEIDPGPVAEDPIVPSRRSEYLEYLEHLISTGEFTREDLVQMVKERYPHVKESTIRTRIIDSKNPKYTSFPGKLVRVNDHGKMAFVE